MAKRFYDTSRIEEEWYLNLSCKQREILRYCESKCDGAGIFSWSAKIATTYIGEKVTDKDLDALPISKLRNGKYFVHWFCRLQNGILSKKSPAHNAIFKSLEINEVSETDLFGTLSNRLSNSLSNRQIEKEREVEIEKEEEGGMGLGKKFTPPTFEEFEAYFLENGYGNAKKVFDYYSVADWHDSSGKPVKNWKQKVQINWFKEENKLPAKPVVKIRQQSTFNTYPDYLEYCKRMNIQPEPDEMA